MKYELPSTELIVIEENNYLKFGEYLNDMQCDDTANKLNLDDLEHVKKLQQENKQLKEVIEEVKRVLRCNNIEVLKYYDEPSETGSYEIVTVDLLQILDKAKERINNVVRKVEE